MSRLLFPLVVLALTTLAASVWWLTAIVPGQDYPQFLVFVRAARDLADPASPFHGTYVLGPWFTPTSLPIHLAVLLSEALGGSIETAGRVLFTMQNVGLVAASIALTHELGRPRWAVIAIFPLLHSAWTVVGGFFAYATALPFVVLSWLAAVRWLTRRDLASGVAVALVLGITLFWHGIAYVQAGLGFATLWFLWRAPSWRDRARSVWPTLPSLAHLLLWYRSQFGGPSGATWLPMKAALTSLVDFIWASVPDAGLQALIFTLIVATSTSLATPSPQAPTLWRVRRPLRWLAAVYLAAYWVLPLDLSHVEGVCNRFPMVAALAAVFAWELPGARTPRALVVSALLGFSTWSLVELLHRFRAFDAETRGASTLIDRLAEGETLYAWPERRGYSPAFGGHDNKASLELEQFATIRHGGLPNSSFAGYGFGYLRYADGHNPMPGLYGPTELQPTMTRFDYVLTRDGQGLPLPHFRQLGRSEGWALFAVCGSRRFPACEGPEFDSAP